MKTKVNILMGLFFIMFGIIFLLNNMGILDIYLDMFVIVALINNYWPLIFIFSPGVLIHILFFRRKRNDKVLLVPAGFLTIFGIILQILVSGKIHGFFWSGFFISLALSLLELYILGDRNKKILIPVYLFAGVSLLFFVLSASKPGDINVIQVIISLAFIAAGIYMLTKKRNPFVK